MSDHDWAAFRRLFIRAPGTHLLGIGMTGSGKTMKALDLAKRLLKEKETIVWFDSAKSDEILYLLSHGLPVHVLYPGKEEWGCQVTIEGSPVEIEYTPIISPEEVFRLVRPGINIVSCRPFFTELTPYTGFISRIMNGLINDAYRRKIKIKPMAIFMDEFAAICPSRRIGESWHQTQLASRIIMATYTLRSEKIRLCAFTQAYDDLHPGIRTQFSFYIICRNPGIVGRDFLSRELDHYGHMFAKLSPEQGITIFPDRRWEDYWSWPMPVKPEGASVEYDGYIITRERRRDREALAEAHGEN